MAATPYRIHSHCMKHNHLSPNQKSDGAPQPAVMEKSNHSEAKFVPSPDEVARRAYFSYENQGSLPGHDVQHWLDAEAELVISELQSNTGSRLS